MTVAHRASAAITVESTDGRSHCTQRRCEPPLTFRSTPVPGTDGSVLPMRWVGTAAGPIGGDRLVLELTVGDDAGLLVDSAGASLVLPGPGHEPSEVDLHVSVGDRGFLRWWPEPAVLVAGCRHRATTRITVGAGARLLWCEELVLGRFDEPSGQAVTRLLVDRQIGGTRVPVLRTGLDIGGVGWRSPAVVGREARIVTQVLAIGHPLADPGTPPPGVWCATSPLATPEATLATIVSASVAGGRRHASALLADSADLETAQSR